MIAQLIGISNALKPAAALNGIDIIVRPVENDVIARKGVRQTCLAHGLWPDLTQAGVYLRDFALKVQ